MSVYSLKQRLCFIHIPKNAGTSIRAALASMTDDVKDFDAIDKQFRKERDPALANHLPYYRLERLLTRAESDIPLGLHNANPLRTFMVVRNPWSRMVSLYFHRMRKLHLKVDGKPRNRPEDIEVAQKGFIPWLLTTPHEGDRVLTRKPQADWGKDCWGDFQVDFVLRQERLTLDWLDLLEEWGLPRVNLPRNNIGGGHALSYRHHYGDSEEAKRHVARFFEEDIERFGYVF